MTIPVEEIVVDLFARTDRLDRQLAAARGRTDQQLSGIEARGRKFASSFSAALGGVSALALARELLTLADASKQIESQLRLATASFGTYATAQKDVERIAADTRGGLQATASLYGAFARSSQGLGKSQEDAARATETFSKALKIGGANAVEASSATLQFGQALASGVLRGDEFNSIAEASPRILRLLADSLGVSQGALRGMAEEGKLTADVLYRALTDRKFTAGIDAEFKQLPVTFGEAMTALSNSAITTFGAFDRGGQFSTALANFAIDGATNLADIEKRAEAAGRNLRAEFAGLQTAFQPLVDGAASFFDYFGGRASQSKDALRELLGWVDSATAFANSPFGIMGKNALLQGTSLVSGYDRGNAASRTASGSAARDRDINDRFRFTPGGSFADAPKLAGTAPTDKPKAKGRGVKGKTEVDYGPDLRNLDPSAGFGFDRLDPIGNPDVGPYLRAVQDGIDRQKEAEAELFRAGEHRVYDLAQTFESALSGRAGSFWDQFKRLGIAVVAQIAARLALGGGAGGGGGLGGLLKSSIGAVLGGSGLPGFAKGGGFTIGGNGGTDRNIMSINGTPVARVSQGEHVGITPQGKNVGSAGSMKAARGGGGTILNQTIHIDNSGSVNPAGYADHIRQAVRQETMAIVSNASTGIRRGYPAVADRLNKLGTTG